MFKPVSVLSSIQPGTTQTTSVAVAVDTNAAIETV